MGEGTNKANGPTDIAKPKSGKEIEHFEHYQLPRSTTTTATTTAHDQ
jgi:hypothetical protein